MKIIIKKKKFTNHLENISKALNVNSPLSSLQGVLINAFENQITMIASNGDLAIKEVIELSDDIQVIEPGKILVPGKLFKEVIKKQSGDITITKEEDQISIKSIENDVKINLLNVNDYPSLQFDTFGKEILVDVDEFKTLIKNVSFAAAELDKRLILNGVNLNAERGVLKITATDSFRLAHDSIEIDSDVEFDITILSKNLKDFIPPRAKGKLKISVNDSRIMTIHDSTTIISKLIDGMYPNVSRLIPTEFSDEIIINSKKLSEMIDKVMVMLSDVNKVARLSIQNKTMILEGKRDEVGNTVVKTNDIQFKGDDFKIPFNIQFLKEANSSFKDDIKICFNGPQKPFVIKSLKETKLIQLILPHRSY